MALFCRNATFSRNSRRRARDILRLCRDEGIRYRDNAVITGDLNGVFRLIEAVFSQYEIPCFLDT
jgi:ATP-dependent helicase/nuclease subunit B